MLRHGESTWNRENRFTGWTDVDLTEKGIAEADRAGELLKKRGFRIRQSLYFVPQTRRQNARPRVGQARPRLIPVEKSWRLNEKHYGMLQGLNKSETAAKYGDQQVLVWRRSYDIAPGSARRGRSAQPAFRPALPAGSGRELPRTESLKETIERIMPYWQCAIFPNLKTADQLLVVAHGNSLRGIIKHLKRISDDDIVNLNLPTAVPYVFEFDDRLNLRRIIFSATRKRSAN